MAGKENNTPAKYAPDGPFGGFKKPGAAGGFIGDKTRGTQVTKFEKGEDYLFFQGPAPKTAIQEDLPSFFSAENFLEAKLQSPLQIAVTVTGVLAFAGVASVFIQ